jgi:hypothetical protein
MGRDPYWAMTDEQVLAKMSAALIAAAALKPGSVERDYQWALFDSAKAELDARMYRHVLAKLRQADGEPAGEAG